MTSPVSLYYWNDQLAKVDPRSLTLLYKFTGAKAVTPLVPNSAQLLAFDAGSPMGTQAAIDAFLGTTNEFLLAAFDSTSLGTDAVGIIVNMQGQCQTLLSAELTTYSSTGGTTVATNHVVSSSALTSTSLTTQCAAGGKGNIALRVVQSGLDSITAGILRVTLFWVAK